MVSRQKREVYQAFARRLLEACDRNPHLPKKNERGFTRALGLLVGVGYKGAEKWIRGESMPDMAHGVLLARNLGESFEYLMTGHGPRHGEPKLAAAEPVMSYCALPEEVYLANAIARLPPKTRESIKHLIEALQHQDEKK